MAIHRCRGPDFGSLHVPPYLKSMAHRMNSCQLVRAKSMHALAGPLNACIRSKRARALLARCLPFLFTRPPSQLPVRLSAPPLLSITAHTIRYAIAPCARKHGLMLAARPLTRAHANRAVHTRTHKTMYARAHALMHAKMHARTRPQRTRTRTPPSPLAPLSCPSPLPARLLTLRALLITFARTEPDRRVALRLDEQGGHAHGAHAACALPRNVAGRAGERRPRDGAMTPPRCLTRRPP
eukprot:6184146-Pleurochrysis_carterae.AAC.1